MHKVLPSCIYTYTAFQLFTDIACMGHIQTIYNYSLPSWSQNRFSILVSVLVLVSALTELTTWLSLIFPSQSGGTYFPTNSPFTPTWGVSSIWRFVGTHFAYRQTTTSSACPIHIGPCGSSSEQTDFRLLALRANDTSSGCVWSSSGTWHFSQGGLHSGYPSGVRFPLAELPTLWWTPSKLFPCRLPLQPYTPLPWSTTPRTFTASIATKELPLHKLSRIQTWIGWCNLPVRVYSNRIADARSRCLSDTEVSTWQQPNALFQGCS